MAGVNVDNVNLTFINYIKGVVETLNNESKMRKYFDSMKWGGSYIEGRVHLERNTAVGNIADGGLFPVAGQQVYSAYNAFRKFTIISAHL